MDKIVSKALYFSKNIPIEGGNGLVETEYYKYVFETKEVVQITKDEVPKESPIRF